MLSGIKKFFARFVPLPAKRANENNQTLIDAINSLNTQINDRLNQMNVHIGRFENKVVKDMNAKKKKKVKVEKNN